MPEQIPHHVIEEIRAQYPEHPFNAALNYIHQKIRYVQDDSRWQRPDYWQFSAQTLRLGTGDCEDTSFLLASILLAMGIKEDDVCVVIGRWHGGGHAWVEVLSDSKCYILESTSGGLHECNEKRILGYEGDLKVYWWGCK
ncbi:MAG: transglutaminase family protein [Nanoarchaeota archaeon]|nr:transglutaminase family protein [Nanoarchaeota archaeon]